MNLRNVMLNAIVIDWDYWFGVTLGVIVFVIILLPCRWDPAIRMKEWLDGNDHHQT